MKSIKKIVALTLATVISSTLFFGCNKTQPTDNKVSSGPKILKLYLNNAGTLDPWFWNWGGLIERMGVFEALTRMDKDLKPIPGCAESWTHNADYTEWTFKLKKDLKWSDGQPLTAKDFEYSMKRVVDPNTFPGKGSAFITGVPIKNAEAIRTGKAKPEELGVVAKDESTLVITLQQPSTILDASVSELWALPVPKHVIDKFGQSDWSKPENIVSNGPYKIKSWIQNTKLELVKNDKYSGKVNLDGIDVLFGEANQLLAYKNGDINVASLGSADMEAAYADAELKKQMQTYKSTIVFHMVPLISENDILQRNPKVRQAIAMSINKDVIANDIMKGSVRPGKSLIPEVLASWGNDIGLKYDTTKSKQLMAEAGFPEGKDFPEMTLYVAGNAGGREMAIKDMIEKGTGIKVKFKTAEYAIFSQDIAKTQPKDTFGYYVNGWGAAYPSYMGYLKLPRLDNNLLNVAFATLPIDKMKQYKAINEDKNIDAATKIAKINEFIRNNADETGKKYLDLLDKADKAVDPKEKEALYKEAAILRENEAIAVPIDWENGVKLIKPEVQGYTGNAIQLGTPPLYFNDITMK